MKRMMMALLLSLGMTGVAATNAYAVCDVQNLKVVHSEGLSGGVQIFDLAPSVVHPTFYYRFTTTDPIIVDNLNAAWIGNLRLRIRGNAAACPAAGLIRNGGVIQVLFRDSF